MYHIIINPASRSGHGMQIWKSLLPIIEYKKVNYKAYFTKKCGDAAFIADKIATMNPFLQGIQLIVLGGDGTLNEVLQGIHDYEHTLIGYIPTGSSNDFARDLGISSDPATALTNILEKTTIKQLDLGLLTYKNGIVLNSDTSVIDSSYERRLFNVSSGIGFDAAVCEQALSSKIKRTCNHLGLGKLSYLGIALTKLLQNKPVSCDVYLDDSAPIHYDNLLFAAAMIHKYEGGGFMFCPNADASDQRLDLCIAHDITFSRAARILPTAFSGKHIDFSEVSILQAHTIRFCSSTPLLVHTDGEVYVSTSEIIWEIYEQKITFVY